MWRKRNGRVVVVLGLAFLVGCGSNDREQMELGKSCRDSADRYLTAKNAEATNNEFGFTSYDLERVGYSVEKKRCLALIYDHRVSMIGDYFSDTRQRRLIDPTRNEVFAGWWSRRGRSGETSEVYFIAKDGLPVSTTRPFKKSDEVTESEFNGYVEKAFH